MGVASWTLHDLGPDRGAPPVLVVVTPGFALDGFLPLVRALHADDHDVHVLELGCDGDAADMAEAVAQAGATLPAGTVVVAHGVGATLALMAAPKLPGDRFVLLAPLLDVEPVAVTSWLAGLVVPGSLDLTSPADWKGKDVASTLLGADHPPLTCLSAGLAADLQAWVRTGDVPVDLAAVQQRVWMAVSLGDDVASVEVVVPASRALPSHELVRMGINGFDRHDYTHGEMITAKTPIRAAVRAAR